MSKDTFVCISVVVAVHSILSGTLSNVLVAKCLKEDRLVLMLEITLATFSLMANSFSHDFSRIV